jgi:hypothetical protein
MKTKECPEILVIQSVADREETNPVIIDHVKSCAHCCRVHRKMLSLICSAERAGSEAELPEGFFESLAERLPASPFPALLVAAVMFTMAALSAFFLNPGYIEWWLSVGITRQFSIYISAFTDLLFLGHSLGPVWIISAFAALVALEVIILNKFRSVEG